MGLLGTLGSIGGFAIGGPIGAAIGGVAGKGISGLLGGGGGGGKAVKQSDLIASLGLDPSQIAQGILPQESERQASISQLLRTVGTLQAQSLNRASDYATSQGLPVATQLAQQRGQALGFAQQAQQGVLDIDRQFNAQRRAGNQYLLNLLFQDQATQQQLAADRRGQSLQALAGFGQAVGQVLGNTDLLKNLFGSGQETPN